MEDQDTGEVLEEIRLLQEKNRQLAEAVERIDKSTPLAEIQRLQKENALFALDLQRRIDEKTKLATNELQALVQELLQRVLSATVINTQEIRRASRLQGVLLTVLGFILFAVTYYLVQRL